MSEVNKLADFSAFQEFTEAELADIEKLFRFKKYKAQEQIIDRQSDSRDVFFVISGGCGSSSIPCRAGKSPSTTC